MSDPRIIRTPAELRAEDPDTELLGPGPTAHRRTASNLQSVYRWWGAEGVLPAAVLRDGARVRDERRRRRRRRRGEGY